MRPALLLLIAPLLAPALLLAQDDTPQRPFAGRQSTIGGGLEINIPVGDFNEVWGRNFWGFSANFTAPARRLPIDYGFDFSYARMGTREGKVFADQAGAADPIEGDLTVKCKLYSYMAQVRLRPIHGRVSPYVEGLFGARQFTTRSELVLDGASDPTIEDRKANAWTGAYGWAAGTLVGFGSQFYVEGRVERLWGGRVSYVDPTSITISDTGEMSYGTLSSATDVVNVQVGIGLRF
jgi:hypothetical protein